MSEQPNIKRKMEKYEEKFKELQGKFVECDKQIAQLNSTKEAIRDELNIVKGRYNELKELLGEAEKPVDSSGSGSSASAPAEK